MAMLGRGNEEIDVRVPDRLLTPEEVKEYCVRSNKNTGEWDFDILANEFELLDLVDWGFDEKDFQITLDDDVKNENQNEDDLIRIPFGDKRDDIPIAELLSQFDFIVCQFSGGKDSIVQYLELRKYVPVEKIKLTCCYTTMDPPHFDEYLDYLERKLEIKIIRLLHPKFNSREELQKEFERKLEKYGYPGRMNNWCNTMFKIEQFKKTRTEIIQNNGIVAMGTRADESSRRAKMRDRGIWNKMPFIFPIFNFSDDDVRNSLNAENIKLHYLYETENRLSCTCCYQQTKKAWARMRRYYPDEWQKALRYYGIAMRNTAFMTGESGYQHDLFSAITADPYIYVTPDDDLGFRGCLYWHPDAS
jgi:3'-phosphoadenosine 5'-phosphosulfate sulfotransferase (PAPS reductase)/FAD synthetase